MNMTYDSHGNETMFDASDIVPKRITLIERIYFDLDQGESVDAIMTCNELAMDIKLSLHFDWDLGKLIKVTVVKNGQFLSEKSFDISVSHLEETIIDSYDGQYTNVTEFLYNLWFVATEGDIDDEKDAKEFCQYVLNY